jgi:hypothetical protein
MFMLSRWGPLPSTCLKGPESINGIVFSSGAAFTTDVAVTIAATNEKKILRRSDFNMFVSPL